MATTTPTRPPTARERHQADDSRSMSRIADDDIARRAYELYEERGGEGGHDMEDWLQAERELERRRGN